MSEISIGFGRPVDENGIARADRQQVATDIGKIAKMLALSSMMLPQPQSLDKNSSLFKYSEVIRNNTKQITKEIIGDEYTELKNNDYKNYYPNVPQNLDKYVDYACMIIAKLIDGVMASKFINEEALSILQSQLEQIEKIISQFNTEANNIHKISDITYIDKSSNNLKK